MANIPYMEGTVISGLDSFAQIHSIMKLKNGSFPESLHIFLLPKNLTEWLDLISPHLHSSKKSANKNKQQPKSDFN